MPKVRVATFNVENLFARYRFNSNVDPVKAVRDGWKADKRYFTIYDEESKSLTAEAVRSVDADVFALQEVENLEVLRRFRNQYLGGRKKFPYAVAIDGNDPRLIDVAVLSRLPLGNLRTYAHLWDSASKGPVFSRDCLEVDVGVPGGGVLTLYVNHLKSMFDKKDPCNGRRNTRTKRRKQAAAVLDIVESRFGKDAGAHPFVIIGDCNDYLETDEQGKTGIDALVRWDQVENVVDRLPLNERWTHFFEGNRSCPLPPAYRQLDYLLLSTSLAGQATGQPEIERRGLPLKAAEYTGPRFTGVTANREASDHCPVGMEVTV